MLQDGYYVFERENNDNHPAFAWDQSRGNYGLGRPVEFEKPLKLRLNEPLSPNFEWVDYHAFPTGPVVSNEVHDVLSALKLYGVQFVPVKVRNPKGPFFELHDYWFVHIWNRIACLDKENSELDIDEIDGRIWSIDKLVLNEEALSIINLQERTLFALAEKTSVFLMHHEVKEAIRSIDPKGIRFFKATEWNSDKTFEK